MSIAKFLRRHRRKTLGVTFALALPAILLVVMAQLAKPVSHEDTLNVAAIALHDYYSVNPPYGVWTFNGVRITDDERLVVDVHVSVIPHATFIETRNKRIRYSYLKLACPAATANVHKWLDKIPVWINLNFHGKTLLEGACPRGSKSSIFAS